MILNKKNEKPFLIKLEKLSWSKPGNILLRNLFVQLAFEAPTAVTVVLAGIFCLQDPWCRARKYTSTSWKWPFQKCSYFSFKMIKWSNQQSGIISCVGTLASLCPDFLGNTGSWIQHSMCLALGTPEAWADKPVIQKLGLFAVGSIKFKSTVLT